MLFIKRLFAPKEKPPIFPNPREAWTCKGYEPYSWTEKDIEYAKSIGYYNIEEQKEDESPYLKGVMSGNDPDYGYSWYLPKKPHSLRKKDEGQIR